MIGGTLIAWRVVVWKRRAQTTRAGLRSPTTQFRDLVPPYRENLGPEGLRLRGRKKYPMTAMTTTTGITVRGKRAMANRRRSSPSRVCQETIA